MSTPDWKEAAEKWEASLPRGVTITVQQIFQAGYAEGIEEKNDMLEKLIDSVNQLKAELESAYRHWDGETSVRKADLEREREANAKLREALEEIDDLSIHDSVVDACDIAKQALLAAKQHTPSEDEELHNAFVRHLKAKDAKQDEGNV